ncbi:hypothetical protein FSP39_025026 [Pinctada imbricata]|uniref:Uncharacterized protein n=1 Tax=Pinctada imbricata TaxID=66713 RepID=A0AA89BVV7_PINIB|nr:hypothetical protein FSP39_025026 [Pinctada imbricata]
MVYICFIAYLKSEIACNDCEWIDFLKPEPTMVSYVRPRPQVQPVYVEKTDTCHDCEETRPQVVYVQPEPKPQTQTVYVEKTDTCHDCEETRPQVVYVQPEPKPQPVYVTNTHECHDCEQPKPQIIYQRPQPQTQTVYVTGTSSGSSSGIIMGALTSGHSSGGHVSGGGGGGGMPVGLHGGSMSTGGGMAGYSGGGSGGSAYCPPMRHDCHPSCIRYDTPHCRRCECYSSPKNQKPKAYKIRIKQERKQLNKKPPPHEKKRTPDMGVRPGDQEE